MPMIDIQRRHAEVFRIRFGDKTDRGAPRKLTDRIRITAPSRGVVEAFVEVYGGDISEWQDQWQAYLPTTALSVLVLPGQSISQWWERYRGSVCERRCDGAIETKTGKPCMCPPDIDQRLADRDACSPTTRVNVLCPDVAVVGSGALVTHGLIAAETLPQSIAVAEAALSRGLMVPAVLRIVEHRGRNHFIVPQIEIVGVSLNELTTGEVRQALPHATTTAPVTAGELPAARFTPVPVDELPAGPQPSVADQVAAVGEPPARPRRANAAAPIPSTGLRPRTAAQAAQDVPADRPDEDDEPAGEPEPWATPEQMAEVKRLAKMVQALDGDQWENHLAWRQENGLPAAMVVDGKVAVTAMQAIDVVDHLFALLGGDSFDDDPGGGGAPAPDSAAADAAPVPDVEPVDEGAEELARARRWVMAQARKTFPDDSTKDREAKRHAVALVALNGRTASTKDMTVDELRKVATMLRDVEEGRITIEARHGGWSVRLGGNEVVVGAA